MRAVPFLVLGLLGASVWFVFRPLAWGDPPAIPSGWGSWWTSAYRGAPASPRPLPPAPAPAHPFMSPSDSAGMHVDAAASDVHAGPGPLGRRPVVRSHARAAFGGQCATVLVDRRERLLAVCGGLGGFELLLLEPEDLAVRARYPLPGRPSTRRLSLRAIMDDISGGAYCYLDRHDRVVLVDAAQQLQVIALVEPTGAAGATGGCGGDDAPRFEAVERHDLWPLLRAHGLEGDSVIAVLPDWQGRYWVLSRGGLVGAVDPASGEASGLRLAGESFHNAPAVDASGLYAVSDHALYLLAWDQATGRPAVRWREPYERGTRRKLGMLSQGSGSTPTLLGEDLVAITDNAEPRVNLLVYRREPALTPATGAGTRTGSAPAASAPHADTTSAPAADEAGADSGRLLCRVPLFEPGASAVENSLIGYGRSLIVENNAGYDLVTTMLFGRSGAGGVWRVDVLPASPGEPGAPSATEAAAAQGCRVIWRSPAVSQTTVPKLSLATGLVYLYTKDPAARLGVDAYYLTALDFGSGATVFEVLTGTGIGYDNNWSPLTLGPGARAYAGTLRGLVAVGDG